MSRETKFRAWDTEAKCYVKEPILFDNFGQVYEVCDERSDKQGTCLITHKPNVIKEQYTGLKDKNGKEIYEGDIVTFMVERFDSITLGFDSEQWHTAVVEWNQDDASYSFVDGDEPFSVQFEAEVIGNIHENPGLLETKTP